MSQRIASLHAEIGADTKGFEQGAQRVKMSLQEQQKAMQSFASVQKQKAREFEQAEKAKWRAAQESAKAQAAAYREAERQQKASAKAARDAARQQEMDNQKAIQSFQRVAIAVIALGVAAKKVFDDWQEYAGSVRDLAIASGTTAKEASTLLQVLDDFQISADDITAAMKAMKENGMVPTLGTLAQLSDQFRAIKDPAERLKFAQDNLGKSYASYLNVLSQGSKVLLENAAAVNKNLILTDAQIAQAEQQRLAIDALSDAWEGLKIQVGAKLGDGIIQMNKNIEESGTLVGILKFGFDDLYKIFFKLDVVETGASRSATAWMDALGGVTAITEEQIKAQEELNKQLQETNAQAINGAIDIQKTNDDFLASQKEIGDQIVELQAQKATYYPWEVEKIQETQDKIDELSAKYNENGKAFVEASQEKISQAAIEAIALLDGVAGYNEAEYERARAIAETAGIASLAAFEQQEAQQRLIDAVATGQISVEDYGKILAEVMADGVMSVDELTSALERIPKDVNTNVNINYSTSGQMNNPYANGTIPGYAEGGIARGSQSGHMAMLHGEEAVIPLKNGSVPVSLSGGGGGSGSSITINMNGGGWGDPEEQARKIAQAVKRVLRQEAVAYA
jgi:hypothetical protein